MRPYPQETLGKPLSPRRALGGKRYLCPPSCLEEGSSQKLRGSEGTQDGAGDFHGARALSFKSPSFRIGAHQQSWGLVAGHARKKERGRMAEKGSKKERAKDLAKDLAKEGLGAAKEATTERSSREEKGEGVLDKARGRLKEAAGAVTGDEERKAEGRAEQFEGTLKDKKGKLKDLLE